MLEWPKASLEKKPGPQHSGFVIQEKAKTTVSAKSNTVTKPKSSTHKVVAETPMPLIYKKDFKKAPVWDFDDVYNQDAPPRPTVS